jgi:hypothetical protein
MVENEIHPRPYLNFLFPPHNTHLITIPSPQQSPNHPSTRFLSTCVMVQYMQQDQWVNHQVSHCLGILVQKECRGRRRRSCHRCHSVVGVYCRLGMKDVWVALLASEFSLFPMIQHTHTFVILYSWTVETWGQPSSLPAVMSFLLDGGERICERLDGAQVGQMQDEHARVSVRSKTGIWCGVLSTLSSH